MSSSEPTSVPDEAALVDIEVLIAALVTRATELVEQLGGFTPFGARLNQGGAGLELIPPVADEEFPAAGEVIAGLVEALRMEAEAGALVACGIAADVLVTLPGAPSAGDAIRVQVEHRRAPAVAAYLPHHLEGDVRRFDGMVRTPAVAEVFGPV